MLIVCCTLASVAVLWPAAAPAAGQTEPSKQEAPLDAHAAEEPLANKEAVVSPTAVVSETKVEKVRSLAEADEEAAKTGTPVKKPADVLVPGNASFQKPASKKEEAKRDCEERDSAPTSKMLGKAGVVHSDDGGIWGPALLLVAAGAAVLLIGLLVVKGAPTSKDRLQVFATVVAIASGAVGMVVTFVPGVEGSDRPAEEATMIVREVHPRITLREFAQRTDTSLKAIKDKTDRREIGNVVWLEITLRGYAEKNAVLQYGLYQERGEVLLDNTARNVPLRVEDADAQTSFVPIWVGYPTGERFQAQFRLHVDGRVRQMAETRGMNGSTNRYSCPDRRGST